mmetsp:Transcript_23357/g.51826  ORF Transcript_23357/g.51826 Transcript_23357/m.51826 type:complete len:374 (+) Transcript_23357:381-1502(+)
MRHPAAAWLEHPARPRRDGHASVHRPDAPGPHRPPAARPSGSREPRPGRMERADHREAVRGPASALRLQLRRQRDGEERDLWQELHQALQRRLLLLPAPYGAGGRRGRLQARPGGEDGRGRGEDAQRGALREPLPQPRVRGPGPRVRLRRGGPRRAARLLVLLPLRPLRAAEDPQRQPPEACAQAPEPGGGSLLPRALPVRLHPGARAPGGAEPRRLPESEELAGQHPSAPAAQRERGEHEAHALGGHPPAAGGLRAGPRRAVRGRGALARGRVRRRGSAADEPEGHAGLGEGAAAAGGRLPLLAHAPGPAPEPGRRRRRRHGLREHGLGAAGTAAAAPPPGRPARGAAAAAGLHLARRAAGAGVEALRRREP